MGRGRCPPLCPHFMGPRACKRVLERSKGIEKTKDHGQVVDKINRSPALSRRRRGFDSLWDCQPNSLISQLSQYNQYLKLFLHLLVRSTVPNLNSQISAWIFRRSEPLGLRQELQVWPQGASVPLIQDASSSPDSARNSAII